MVKVKVTNWKNQIVEGEWNEKFYEPQVEGDSTGIFRIYIDNERVHITEEEKERLIKQISLNKIDEDNRRISIIKSEFEKLDKEAQKKLLDYLEFII